MNKKNDGKLTLIASIAFVCIKKALAYDNSTFSTGHNISDVFSSEDFFDKAQEFINETRGSR